MSYNKQLIAALIIQQQCFQQNLYLSVHHLYSSDYLMSNLCRQRSDFVTRIHNYFEITIPQYSIDDFKMHFRLTRETLHSTYARLIQCDVYTKSSGPQPNLEKEFLMFLWYIGNLESFRSMADRFGTSKGSFHASITRVSSALLEIMPEVIKCPETMAKINETSQQFGEKSEFQNILGAIDGSHIPIKAPTQQP